MTMPALVSIRPDHRGRARRIRRYGLAAVLVGMLLSAGAATGSAAPPPTTPAPPPMVTAPAVPAPNTTAAPTPAAPTPPPTTAPEPPPGQPCPQTPDGCAAPPGGEQSPGAAPEPECGLDNISGCVVKAMDGFFSAVVSSALNPLLELLSKTLLTTPDPASVPEVGKLWGSSWQITLTVYGLLVMAAGILVMSYQTLQSRWSLREIAPGVVIGMLAAGLSSTGANQAVRAVNALSVAVAGNGTDPDSAAKALREKLTSYDTSPSGTFTLLLSLVLVVLVAALLAGYVIRVATTIVLVVAAPLALMCHALPVTEPIARWWWRSMAACLAIQVVQSLTLITATRTFLTSGNWNVFGTTQSGSVNQLVSIAMVWLLVKIPFWMLSVLKIRSGGHSMVGGMIRSYLMYKTFGLLGKGGKRPKRPPRRTPGKPDIYDQAETLPDGQMMLPLRGLKFVAPKPEPKPPRLAKPSSKNLGKQLALDFDTPAPPLPPEAPRPEGQLALFYATPVTKPPTRRRPSSSAKAPRAGKGRTEATPAKRPAKGRQLTLRFPPAQPTVSRTPRVASRPADPTPKSTADGQYLLPFDVTKVKKPPSPPAPVWIAPPAQRRAGRQLHIPYPDLPVRRRRRGPDTTGGGLR
ncbi:hypothetical protein ABIA39_000269 [Nocardia sp. GAS34]|uniref:hypothetical protein n=1 Tax=unclassified Nocardia TaxID=2637762 RepID=UPI003D19CBC0